MTAPGARRPHPLAALLENAAGGRFPPTDGAVEVFGTTGGRCDALVAFTGHVVLAADIDPDEVTDRVGSGDFDVALSAPFVTWLATRLGRPAASHDVLLVAPAEDRAAEDQPAPPGLAELNPDRVDHPRVARAVHHRDGLRVFSAGGDDLVLVGRGLLGRWEVSYEVAEDGRSSGRGRSLAAAARSLVPAGEAVWAQVAPGNAASLRAVLAAGFRPVGAEVLFPRDGGRL